MTERYFNEGPGSEVYGNRNSVDGTEVGVYRMRNDGVLFSAFGKTGDEDYLRGWLTTFLNPACTCEAGTNPSLCAVPHGAPYGDQVTA
jgi:hypothetical protein